MVIELDPEDPKATVCGVCGRAWDDSISTSTTPVPAGRCPFEYEHHQGMKEFSITVGLTGAWEEWIIMAESKEAAQEGNYELQYIKDSGAVSSSVIQIEEL